ncbi:MAG TPA: BlaI/MecI/CopY family transcriptional regulator [Bryobacteraceae bacterium]|nr:BlaI/MecI/CopY family transcriptional regulator [Bryobacteraceae bacterium]
MRTPRQPKEIPPPLELECLKALWAIGEGNVRTVQRQLEPRRRLAYTTVMTLLERLVRKGGASRRKLGRAFLYLPLLDRETLRRKAILELTDSLFEGSEQLLLRYVRNGSAIAAAAGASESAHVDADGRLDTSLL